MKTNPLSIFFTTLFFYFLIFPESGLLAAKSGLMIWYQSLLPALLPIMILSGIFIQSNLSEKLTTLLGYPLCRILPLSGSAVYAVMIGFLCGCPMGLKTLCDFKKQEKISDIECVILAPVINHLSPAFFMNYLIRDHLKKPSLLVPTLLILYGASIIFGLYSIFLNRNQLSTYEKKEHKKQNKTSATMLCLSVVDVCITDGIHNITKLGGYIILFSILASLINALPILTPSLKAILLGITEVSVGIHAITALPLPFDLKYVLSIAVCTFGGLCCTAQSIQMLRELHISIFSYLKGKFWISMIAVLLTLIFLK